MINLNANINSVPIIQIPTETAKKTNINNGQSNFANTIKAAGKQISNVDDLQQITNHSIKDLLTGKNEDVTSVISAMAKADMSFKILVGVRNKLIEAYKKTMNMPL